MCRNGLAESRVTPVEYKIAGEWMKRNLDPGLILTRKPQLAYYAGMPSFGPSVSATSDTVVGEATAAKARYVCCGRALHRVHGARLAAPARRRAASTPRACAGSKAIVSPYPEARVVIYEVVSLCAGRGAYTHLLIWPFGRSWYMSGE